MPHLSANNLYGMVFEQFQNYFHLEDSTNRFPQLLQLCFHIVQSHIPHQIMHILGAIRLLTMTKPSGGVCSIVMGEALYRLTSHVVCF
jgi:hypothetical protein